MYFLLFSLPFFLSPLTLPLPPLLLIPPPKIEVCHQIVTDGYTQWQRSRGDEAVLQTKLSSEDTTTLMSRDQMKSEFGANLTFQKPGAQCQDRKRLVADLGACWVGQTGW